MYLNNKRAQAWGFDLMIASMIFIGGIIIFYLYALNNPLEAGEKLNSLSYNGDVVSKSLLSEGSPENWNASNVISPGILSSNKINETKLQLLYNLTIFDYQRSKSLFKTNYDYFIFLSSENFTINNQQILGIGVQPLNPKNLIKNSRITIYKDKVVTINIDVWE